MSRGRVAFGLTTLACAWLVCLVPAAAIVPVYSGETSTSAGEVSRSSATLLAENGSWVLWLMAVPALLGLIAWIGLHRKCSGRGRRDATLAWFPISVLLAFSIIGGFSVGIFVLPAAVALVVAGALTPDGRVAA
jgi:uncharacterized membrane protein